MVLENTTSIISVLDVNYLFGSLATFLGVTACVAGVSFQTFIKWWDKWQDGQPIPFDRKFLGTAVATLFGALVIAIPLQAAASERIDQYTSIYGLIIAWIMTAAWAYALNNGVNGIVTKLEQRGENNLVKSGRLDALIERKVEERLEIAKQLNTTSVSTGTTSNKTPSGVVGGEDVTQPQ